MSKSIKIVRTFPTAWYKFIVEGDTKSLPESERLIAESALTSAFPDGGDIIATKMMKGTQKFSSLVCESYSVQGMKDKSEGKTFKVKVLANEVKNPNTYKKYVSEGIEDLRKRRSEAPRFVGKNKKDYDHDDETVDDVGSREEGDLSLVRRAASGSDKYANPGQVTVLVYAYDEWKKLFGTSLTGDKNRFDSRGRSIESPDGTAYELISRAAKRLKEEIKKAFVSEDKKRLEELRSVLPVLAYDIGNSFNATNTLKVFKSGGDKKNQNMEEFRDTIIQNMIQTIALLYNNAFGLDNENPFLEPSDDPEMREKFGEYASFPTSLKEVVGNDETIINAKKKLTDGKIDRGQYVDAVFENLFYGRNYAENSTANIIPGALDITGQGAAYDRASKKNFYKGLVDYIRENPSEFNGSFRRGSPTISESMFNYASMLYTFDNIRSWTDIVDSDVLSMSAPDGELTVDNLIDTFQTTATSMSEDNKDNRNNRLNVFKYVVHKVFEKHGIKTNWSDREIFRNWREEKIAKKQNSEGNDSDETSGEDTVESITEAESSSKDVLKSDQTYPGTFEEFQNDAHGVCEEITERVDGIEESFRADYADYRKQVRDIHNDVKKNGGNFRPKKFTFRYEITPTFANGERAGDYYSNMSSGGKNVRNGKTTTNRTTEKFIVEPNDNFRFLYDILTSVYRNKLDSNTARLGRLMADDNHVTAGEVPMTAAQSDFVIHGIRAIGDEGVGDGTFDAEVADDDIGSADTTMGSKDVQNSREVDELGSTENVSKTANYDMNSDPETKKTASNDFGQRERAFLNSSVPQIRNCAENMNLSWKRAVKIRLWLDEVLSTSGGYPAYLNLVNSKDSTLAQDRNAIDAEVKKIEAQRKEDLKSAKQAVKDAKKNKAEKSEIAELEKTVKELSAHQKLSKKEKQDIAIALHGGTDLDRPLNVVSGQTYEDRLKAGIKDKAARADPEMTTSMIRDDLMEHGVWSNDSYVSDDDTSDNNNTYRGVPDLLILLAYDDIVDYHESHNEKSLEECINIINRNLSPSYYSYITRRLELDKIATLKKPTNESVGDDKYLASVEALIDLIENSEADAQRKLDMLEVVTTGFQAWCEKNEIVPEEINPEEDKDAVANHPEDDGDGDESEEDK